MTENKPLDQLIGDLKERAKELNCLYKVQEILNETGLSMEQICYGLLKAIPPGWQYPDICEVEISIAQGTFKTFGFADSTNSISSTIQAQERHFGQIKIMYTEIRPKAFQGAFLKEELKLIKSIADSLGQYLLHLELKAVFENKNKKISANNKNDWEIILDMLKHTDPKLLIRLSRKMINMLCWTNVSGAENLLERFSPSFKEKNELSKESNAPFERMADNDLIALGYEVFLLASKNIDRQDILTHINKWITEDRSVFLTEKLENMGSSLEDISNAVERYYHLGTHASELSATRDRSLRIALITRLLTDQPEFIDVAKNHLGIDHFNDLIQRLIYPLNSHGKIGGKSAGLFLAQQLIKEEVNNEALKEIKIPKTWYIASDGLLNFMSYNNLEDMLEQKYKEIGLVRQEYPYVIHVFKSSVCSPEILKGLSLALDDFGEVPLIVRSSSLLEDRVGTAFAGKYKSLFIPNKGSKEKRLAELTDAIAEVYASIFGPDPIEYRAQNKLLDFHEEMGIMIQEVVGKQVGNYFFPSFAGVGFSQNHYPWSSRIEKKDGLLRLVPGLGTRAVDRISNDYPVLVAPGKPNLRVNTSPQEIIRYTPRFIDLINTEKGEFETIEIDDLLKQYGADYPQISKLVSLVEHERITPAKTFGLDFEKNKYAFTFENLLNKTPFIPQIKSVLEVLEKKCKLPVDIEFAHDGEFLYLLQCRSQSQSIASKAVPIPADIPEGYKIFSASRFVTNAFIQNLTHIVYVDPNAYGDIDNLQQLINVGKAVSKLNQLLPRRQFILMGPGRWGSRGDIKLGVSVSYSDINNTAMLIEIARKKNDYTPDLSFGTHFFQDLVESNIRYLPLYPDESNCIFNETFLMETQSVFTDLIPEYTALCHVIRVIDIPATFNGKVLNVAMNSSQNKALAYITQASELNPSFIEEEKKAKTPNDMDIHWQWRLLNVERMASLLNPKHFGVKAMYLFGSVKNANAKAESDINLLIHFSGSNAQLNELKAWLAGWSQSLAQINFLRTGFKCKELLDVHFISDDDIKKKSVFARKINAVTDAARPLPLGTAKG
jgi:predicted nucleotidyltransferase